MTDLAAEEEALLRLLAREAMSVGWYDRAFFSAFIDDDDERAFSEADARFFAALTPSVVLRLLDAARSQRDTEPLREAAQAVIRACEPDEDFDGQFVEYLVPFAAIDALRGALGWPDGR